MSSLEMIWRWVSAALARFGGLAGQQHFIMSQRPSYAVLAGRSSVLPIRYTYRATIEGLATYTAVKAGCDVSYRLYAMNFVDGKPVAGELCLACDIPRVGHGDVLAVNLLKPSLMRNGKKLHATAAHSLATRKFVAEIQMKSDGQLFSRLCSHYLPFEKKSIGSDYYFRDDYFDYPRQTVPTEAVALVKKYAVTGRLLDVGCALGIYTKAFLNAGLDAYGVDSSEFATSEASVRAGVDRIRCVDLDVTDIPFAGTFDILWMWDVLEHFSVPEAVLAKVTAQAKPGTMLFIHTSNCGSLTHRVFGEDWEGYTDYSHFGVNLINSSILRKWLDKLGWDIIDWKCEGIWAHNVDPIVIRFQQVFQEVQELRVFLDESELGDFISLVAQKRICAAS